MNINLSHLYKREVADICGLFTVTIREVPHGEAAKLQASLMSSVRLDITGGKKGIRNSINSEVQNALSSGKFSPTEYSDQKNLMAIESWTLVDDDGKPVPVSMEAWNALPHSLTEQIEKVIARLNPEMDEDFQDEPGSAGES